MAIASLFVIGIGKNIVVTFGPYTSIIESVFKQLRLEYKF
jgi:hypothetical protein